MVSQVWNPDAPDVLGLQWRPIHLAGLNPAVNGPYSMTLRSRSAETIEKLRWSVRGSAVTDQHMMIVDIYETGQEIGQSGTTVNVREYAPISDAFVGPTWRRRVDGLTTNLWEKINESPVQYPAVRTDFGVMTDGQHQSYRFRVGSGSHSLFSRIVKLAFRYVIASMGYEWRLIGIFLHWAGAGGPLEWSIPGGHITTHYYGQLVEVDLGEVNPLTLGPWTPQDVRDFSIASGWQIEFRAVANPEAPAQVISAALKVYSASVDYRKAVALWRRPAIDMSSPRAIDSDKLVTMPAGTANWAKAASKDYSLVHRVANDSLVQYVSPRSTDIIIDARLEAGTDELGRANIPIPGMAAALVTLDPYHAIVKAINDEPSIDGYSRTHIPVLMMMKAGSVMSEDSQPYGHGYWDHSFANAVRTGLEEYQEIVPASTQSYLGVDFQICPPRLPENQASTVTVQIRTTAGAAVGGSFTISAADVKARFPTFPLSYDHQRVSGFLSSGAALTGGVTYRIHFSSNAPAADPWYIGTAGVPDSFYTDVGTTPPNGDIATFQGASGRGTYLGVVDSAIDLMVTLMKQPAVPTGATATVIDVAMEEPPDFVKLYCHVSTIETVGFSWAASAYTGFARWRIQREEADIGLWTDIAIITSEAQKSYRDYTTRRGVAVRYRVRAEMASGAFSEWATSGQVLPRAKHVEVIFTSDADPGLTVAYDRKPRVVYSFLSADEDTFVTVAGANYQQVYMSPRDRGVRFNYDVFVNMIAEPDFDRKGPDAFLPLQEIARSTEIPYVVVLDHEGHRWYAHIQMPEGVNEQPGHVYETTVTVTKVSDTPVLIEQP